MAVKKIPAGFRTVTPFLLVERCPEFIAFLKKAFGAKVTFQMKGADGKVMHAEIKIGDSMVMTSEAQGDWKAMPSMIHLYVTDVDAWHKKAVKAGGKPLREPEDQFYGDRSGGIVDAWGNQWWTATHIKDVSPREMTKGMKEFAKKQAENKPAS